MPCIYPFFQWQATLDRFLPDDPFMDTSDRIQPLKWIVLARVIFCVVLIFSSLVFSTGENLSFLSQPFVSLYYLAAAVLLLSVGYGLWLNRGKICWRFPLPRC